MVWISNFIPHFMMDVINYPCKEKKLKLIYVSLRSQCVKTNLHSQDYLWYRQYTHLKRDVWRIDGKWSISSFPSGWIQARCVHHYWWKNGEKEKRNHFPTWHMLDWFKLYSLRGGVPNPFSQWGFCKRGFQKQTTFEMHYLWMTIQDIDRFVALYLSCCDQ